MNEEDRTGDKKVINDIIHTGDTAIPVVKEEVFIEKRERVTGEIVIDSHTDTRSKNIPLTTTRHGYREVRVPRGEVVESMPQTRRENGRLIIPVVREEEVVVKRLVLVEEVHLIPDTTTEQRSERVELRTQNVTITRKPNS